MSHHATNWAIRQRGLKPATKLVLWHLCDRHNPDEGCFPSQDRLADDCEMSRSSLNEHLKILEEKGLICRQQRLDERTKRHQSTRYFFAFEDEFSSASKEQKAQHLEEPCPENGHGAVSGNQAEPCPENDESRVQIPDTNLVREPVREPPVRASARAGELFSRLWSEWPDLHRPDNREAVETIFRKLSPEDQSLAIEHARSYRRVRVLRSKPARMVTYLKERLFLEFDDAPEIDGDGDFIITPKRPEWSEWLGSIRAKYGEQGVQSAVRTGFVKTPRRWPERISQAA